MRSRLSVFALAIVSVHATTLSAQSSLRPAPSTRATSVVTLAPPGQQAEGATPLEIKLDYGQPHLRGRTLHTDSLVPYDKPWRTGANAVTTLETGVDLVIGGSSVPKGSYVIYTIPGRAVWKLILQKQAGQTPEYNPALDFVRIDLRRRLLPEPIESFSMWLIPSTDPSASRGELRLAWGMTALSTDWSVK